MNSNTVENLVQHGNVIEFTSNGNSSIECYLRCGESDQFFFVTGQNRDPMALYSIHHRTKEELITDIKNWLSSLTQNSCKLIGKIDFFIIPE